jgi:hypothetical protein
VAKNSVQLNNRPRKLEHAEQQQEVQQVYDEQRDYATA